MSATIICLKSRSERPSANGSLDAVEEGPAAEPSDAYLDGTRVRLLLEGLRAQQDTLLSVIESLRAPVLRAHPNFGCSAADLEATSTQALAEISLLIRHGTALLLRQEKAKAYKINS